LSEAAPRLERTIGLGGSALLSFNGAVGAAIFALPAALLVDWGPLSPWLFLVVGVAALLVVVPFTRTAAAFSESGGPATYGLVYGRLGAFQLGWIYYVARTAGFAANTNVFADYLGRWLPSAKDGVGRAATIISLCAFLALLNVLGMKRAIRVLGGFTVLKALPLIVAGIAAAILFWPPPTPVAPREIGAVETGFLIVFYAFVGFENAVVPTGETRNPAATLPRAIVLTTALTALLYFVVQFGFVSAFNDAPPESAAPLIDLGSSVAGQFGAVVLTLAALCSLLGNLLGVSASTPRVTYAMADRGDLPRWFAKINRRFESPANSILFLAVIVALLAISGSFVWLAIVSTLARMIIYPVTIAALPLLPERPRLSIWTWLSGAIGICICVWGATQADSLAWGTFAALAGAGLLLYYVSAFRRARVAQ
jgi:amino acid transporter